MPELGIVLPNVAVATGSVTPEALIAIAEAADAHPAWGYAWVGDSLFSVPRLESVVLLTAFAARTRRLRLGIGCVASLGLREPLSFAVQRASLDVLSKDASCWWLARARTAGPPPSANWGCSG